MELYRGVYQIQSLYGGRNLFQYLLVGDNLVLVDTGIGETPEKVIFPYMDRLKLDPRRLTLAVTTHSDLDHQGGNAAIKRISPQTLLACGELDRELVEDPDRLYNDRYNFLEAEHGLGADRSSLKDAGSRRKMDLCFSGGETLSLADDWRLQVLHVPGHSRGHLSLYDPKHKALLVGDAIHGRGCPDAKGKLALPVTYYQVDIYLSTLRHFETLAFDHLYSGHWPNMTGEEGRDFIAESRRTVEFIDRVILDSLKKNPAGRTLKELIDAVANAVGDWPAETTIYAMFPVKGHLDRLEEQGKVKAQRASRPVKWQMA